MLALEVETELRGMAVQFCGDEKLWASSVRGVYRGSSTGRGYRSVCPAIGV